MAASTRDQPEPTRARRPGRVRMRGAERREQLIEVARRLFAEKGFEGTSVEEIAATAEVSKPVVYEHFGGKEGLYAVVVDREVGYLLAEMETALTDGERSRELIEQAALALLDYVETHTDGFRILVRDSSVGQLLGLVRQSAERHRLAGRGAARDRVQAPRPGGRRPLRCTPRCWSG